MSIWVFQSTRPSRGATSDFEGLISAMDISIHAPLAGRDGDNQYTYRREFISIHAPLAGRDSKRLLAPMATSHFNPRAPRGARQQKYTNYFTHFCEKRQGFNHFCKKRRLSKRFSACR